MYRFKSDFGKMMFRANISFVMFAIWLYVGFDNILLSVMYAGIVGYLYYAMCEYLDSVPTRKKEPIHERYIVGTAISFVLFVLIPSNLVPAIRPWIEISSTTLSAAVMPEDSVSSFRVIFEMYILLLLAFTGIGIGAEVAQSGPEEEVK